MPNPNLSPFSIAFKSSQKNAMYLTIKLYLCGPKKIFCCI